jgi:hypothetical protein
VLTLTCIVVVCDRLPEVPTKLTCTGVAVGGGASLAAVSVRTKGLFGVTEMVDGETLTPAGRPCTATEMAPLNVPVAVLLSVTCPLAPGVSVSVPGETASVKSPAVAVAFTVSDKDVLALALPETPCTVTVLEPMAAVEEAVKVNVVLAPTVTVAFAGAIVTPAGSPLTEIWMEPAKLFALLGVTVKVRLSPCAIVTDESAASVKALSPDPPDEPLLVAPHPAISATRQRKSRHTRGSFT